MREETFARVLQKYVREEHKLDLASGFTSVLVNGVAVIADGRATGARPGRALR